MRKILLLVWLMLPVLVGAYHYGPGQQRLLLDDVSAILAQADEHAAAEHWAVAVKKYEEALALLPAERVHEARRIRLERAKAQMFDRKLPEAHQDLTSLVDELKSSENADDQLLFEARSALSNSQYYMTWLMRLEGQPRERWSPRSKPRARPTACWPNSPNAAGMPKRPENIAKISNLPFGSLAWISVSYRVCHSPASDKAAAVAKAAVAAKARERVTDSKRQRTRGAPVRDRRRMERVPDRRFRSIAESGRRLAAEFW